MDPLIYEALTYFLKDVETKLNNAKLSLKSISSVDNENEPKDKVHENMFNDILKNIGELESKVNKIREILLT